MSQQKLAEKDFEGKTYDKKGKLILKPDENQIAEYEFKHAAEDGKLFITNLRTVWVSGTPKGMLGQKGRHFVEIMCENILSTELKKNIISIHFKPNEDDLFFFYTAPFGMSRDFESVNRNETIFRFMANKSDAKNAIDVLNNLIK